MKGHRRYAIGAGFADYFFLGSTLFAAPALYDAISWRFVEGWALLLLFLFIVVAVLIYHVELARRVSFRTPGELLMGCVVMDRAKRWVNPYGINRALLFVVCFVALILASNTWYDLFYSGFTVHEVLFRLIVVATLLLGIVMMGMKRAWGGLLVALYFVYLPVAGVMSSPMLRSLGAEAIVRALLDPVSGFCFLMAFLSVVAVFVYHRAAADQPLQPAAPGEQRGPRG